MAVTSMLLSRRALMRGLTSLASATKSPVIAALPLAGRLKIDGDRRTHGAGNRHSILLDAVRPGHAELVDAVVVAPLEADRLVDFRRINAEIGCGRSRSRAHLPRGLAFLQRDPRHCGPIVRHRPCLIRACRRSADWRAAGGCARPYLQTFRQQFRHHGIDLRFGQDEIAHHHRRVAHRLERDPAAERKARLELDAVEADLEIGSGKSIAVNRAAYRRGAAKDEIDFLPVRFGRRRRFAHSRERDANTITVVARMLVLLR